MTIDPAYNLNPFYKIIDCHWGDKGPPAPETGVVNVIWVWPGQTYTLFTETTTFTGSCGAPGDPSDQGTQIIDGPDLTSQTLPGIGGSGGNISLPTESSCPTDNPLFPKPDVFNGQRIDTSVLQGDPPGDPPDPTVTDITFQTVATISEISSSPPAIENFTDTVIVNLAVQKAIGTGFFAPTDNGELGRAARIQGLIQAALDALQSSGTLPQVLIYQPPPDPGP